MSSTVSESVARPARTAVQAVPAFVITEFVDSFITNLDDKQYAALAGLLLLVFGYVQVLIENNIGKAFLRKMPAAPEPVVGDEDKPQATLTGSYPSPTLKADAVRQAITNVEAGNQMDSRTDDGFAVPENAASDTGDENPDLEVGDPIIAEHDLDIDTFYEEDEK